MAVHSERKVGRAVEDWGSDKAGQIIWGVAEAVQVEKTVGRAMEERDAGAGTC